MMKSMSAGLMELLLRACRETPDWERASGLHWVMDLGWYKRVRRGFGIPDGEQDEDKWVPDPRDTLFGYPVEVREDGGVPHLVSERKMP